MINDAQVSQDAQAGYACDYQNKRQPMACNEVKECCKGHAALSQELSGLSAAKIWQRFASRLMSDAYGKGVVRSQTENKNLCIHAGEQDVTHAETRRTSDFAGGVGSEFVGMVQRLDDGQKGRESGPFLHRWPRPKEEESDIPRCRHIVRPTAEAPGIVVPLAV